MGHVRPPTVPDNTLDGQQRAFPSIGSRLTFDETAWGGRNALSDLLFPVLLLRDRALQHNLDLMARFCDENNVDLAPHGKTSMSPQLIKRQLDAGAWGITAANPSQARVFRTLGVRRILIANQVVDQAGLRWIASELDSDQNAEIYCVVDSERGIDLMEEALTASGFAGTLPVLVELGFPGGRTGCRTAETAKRVANAARSSEHLRLVGVEGYEGIIDEPSIERTIAKVDSFLLELQRLAIELAADGAFADAQEVIITAGGSTYFDRVVKQLAHVDIGRPARIVLRSGCYLTHDHGHYQELGPLGSRMPGWDSFQAAFEVWGMVQSRPEPTLAILGFGKRDVSYDIGLPRPLKVLKRGARADHASPSMEIFALNDQHAYLRLNRDDDLQVGDLVGCGISHPCTIFDKWRVIPLVDDAYRIIGAVETLF